MSDDRQRLVCAPYRADIEAVPGTVFTYRCMECKRNVCVSPASQALLKSNSKIEIICYVCLDPEEDDEVEFPPGMMQELSDYFRKKAN